MSFSSQPSPNPALVQIYNAGVLYKNGGTITVTPTSKLLVVSPCVCRDSENVADINVGNYWGETYQDPFGTIVTVAPFNTTVNGAANGLNGLDTGTLAASTVYALYAIADASNQNPSGYLLSLNTANAPYMPVGQFTSGYNLLRRIGWAVTNSSTQFEVFLQSGNANVVTYSSNVPIAALTSGATASQTPIDLTTKVPAVDGMMVLLGASLVSTTAADTATVCYSGATIASQQNILTAQVTSVPVTQQMQIPLKLISGAPKIDYEVSNTRAALTLYVNGFVDCL